MTHKNAPHEMTDEQLRNELSDEELSGPKINRRTSLKLLSVAGLTGLAGCTGGSGSGNGSGAAAKSNTNSGSSKSGGTLKAGWLLPNIDELDPPKINHTDKVAAMINIFNGLLKVNSNLEIVGDISKDWTVDGTKYTFQLRKNVKFHNGDDFTADDVKYTFTRLFDQELPTKDSVSTMKNPNNGGVVVKDDHTVELNWKEPYAPALVYLTRQQRVSTVVNKNAIKKLGKEYSSRPVGTGPFKVEKHVANQNLILKRFDDYFETDSDGKKLPYLDGVDINLLPEVSTATSAFQSGSIDFLQRIPPQSYDKIEKSPDTTVNSIPFRAWRGLEMNETKEPFSSKEFRLGIAKLIDSKEFVKTALFGVGVPAVSPLPKQYWPKEDPKPDFQNYNPEKGRRLIRKSGHEGAKFSILGRPDELRWSKVLSQMLNKAGDGVIDVTVNEVTSAQSSDLINNIKYDTWIGGGSNIGPDGLVYNFYTPDGTFNWTGYENPKVTKLLKKERQEMNRSKRAKQLLKIDHILMKEAPHAYLFHDDGTYGRQNYVKGFPSVPSIRPFHTVWMDK